MPTLPTPFDLAEGKTILLDSFTVELRVAATLSHEAQRDILMQLDESSFNRRVLPDLMRTLHYSKMQMIQAVIRR